MQGRQVFFCNYGFLFVFKVICFLFSNAFYTGSVYDLCHAAIEADRN